MATELTKSRGIRLPERLWNAIDGEAKALKMSPNEFLMRRLGTLFVVSADVQNSTNYVPNRDTDLLELE